MANLKITTSSELQHSLVLMLKLILLCALRFFVHCEVQEVVYELEIYVTIRQTWLRSDSLKCSTYSWVTPVGPLLQGFQQAHYHVRVVSNVKSYRNQVLSKRVLCAASIRQSSKFAALLDERALAGDQLGINGSFTVLVHVEERELLWTASILCTSTKPMLFLETKEFNLSYTYTKAPALFVEFLRTFHNLYCASRVLY